MSSRTPPAKARAVIDRLAGAYPGATTELAYRTPVELLVATILSAQSTDARVNQVTPTLFDRFPDVHALASADVGEVERIIQSTGFFRTKARAITAVAQQLVERHAGEVPASMDALVHLSGVGRKTANVVLGHALGIPGLPVDRHVLRVAARIGLTRSDDPEQVERELCAQLPPEQWTLASDCLILHGRRICRPKPLCPRCVVASHCDFFKTGGVILRARRTSSPATDAPRGSKPAASRGAARNAPQPGPSARGGRKRRR